MIEEIFRIYSLFESVLSSPYAHDKVICFRFFFILFKATEYIYVIDTVMQWNSRKPNQFFCLMKIGIIIILKLQRVVVV